MHINPNPVLVNRWRGNINESYHRGIVCLVNENDEVIFSIGDVEQVCFPRSALKFFQVMPLIESGAADKFNFTQQEIAIMCGSHNGEPGHVKAVHGILEKINLSESNLNCGPQYPYLRKDYSEMYKTDQKPKDIHNNCSGKHAGFLAMCVFGGYSTKGYLEPDHPVQQQVQQIVAEMHNYPAGKMEIATDGCSAPIYSMPVRNQAIGYKNLAKPAAFDKKRQEACKRIVDAVTGYPHMIAGTSRYCTDMMEICGSRIFGKTGADGIFSLGFKYEGIGCTIKIEDGRMGPQYNVAQEIILNSGIFTQQQLQPLEKYLAEPLTNWNGIETGVVSVNAELFEGLEDTFADRVQQ